MPRDRPSPRPCAPMFAMTPLIPFVTNRVSSSSRMPSASRRDQVAPIGVASSRISFPIEYMMTLGWLKSFETRSATSCRQRLGKSATRRRRSWTRPHVGELVHHEHAVAVARVQHPSADRVVRAADGVEAGILQQSHTPVLGRVESRRTERAAVVVHACATQLDDVAVDAEARAADRAGGGGCRRSCGPRRRPPPRRRPASSRPCTATGCRDPTGARRAPRGACGRLRSHRAAP